MDNGLRKQKGKIFAQLEWLEVSQAASCLAELTETGRLHYEDMLSLCENGALPAYMDFLDLKVELMGDDAGAPVAHATGQGRCKVQMPMVRNYSGMSWVHAIGPVSRQGAGGIITEDAEFRMATSASNAPVLQFHRADVEKLANEIHPLPEKPIHGSERRGIEQLIAVLADMAGLDISKPYSADEVLRTHAATKGLALPASSETVARHLKAATARVENHRKKRRP